MSSHEDYYCLIFTEPFQGELLKSNRISMELFWYFKELNAVEFKKEGKLLSMCSFMNPQCNLFLIYINRGK